MAARKARPRPRKRSGRKTTRREHAPPYRIERTGRSVVTVRIKIESAPGWEQWFLLRGDAHHDNPHCRQDLELKHLDEAKARNAGIIDIGDLFCAMQGKYDPRHTKRAVRPEHQVDDYLDALVRTAADFYEPYAKHFVLVGRGNHEQGILKRHEVDLTERLVATLNDRTGSTIQSGGWTGWVRFLFSYTSQHIARVLWYTHGYGGGGPVTQDMIQNQRQRAYIENADVMLSGHTHDAWANETRRLKLNSAGTVETRSVWYVKTPTYKDDYGDGFSGWHVNTGKPPKPLGGWWLKFALPGARDIGMQVLRAE